MIPVNRRFQETIDSDDHDYHGLDQGQLSTTKRHAIVKEICPNPLQILDVGCGTGLILDQFEAVRLYHGIDLFYERVPHLVKRITEKKIPSFSFQVISPVFSDLQGCLVDLTEVGWGTQGFSLGLAIGICGYSMLDSVFRIQHLFRSLRVIADCGVITVPMKSQNQENLDWLVRFDEKDLFAITEGWEDVAFRTTKETEMAITW